MPQIFECAQGTPEWLAARMGIPTASQFSTVMASGRGGKESETRRKYMYDLVGEIITGEPTPNFSNSYTERGHVQEPDARNWYAFVEDVEPRQVGFIRNDRLNAGCSPDALIGETGMLEIKTRLARLQLELLFDGKLPSEHKAQCQGNLWVAEREWIDFVSYCPKIQPFKTRVHRDERYIAELKVAVDHFNAELAELLPKARRVAA